MDTLDAAYWAGAVTLALYIALKGTGNFVRDLATVFWVGYGASMLYVVINAIR